MMVRCGINHPARRPAMTGKWQKKQLESFDFCKTLLPPLIQQQNIMSSQQSADLSGVDIGKVMSATGPIVKAVLLRCQPENTEDDNQKISAKEDSAPSKQQNSTKEGGDESDDESISPEQAAEIRLSTKSLISQIEIDTTPKKSQVQHILGKRTSYVSCSLYVRPMYI